MAKRRTDIKKTAEMMAAEQRAISVAEFFEKNRHLLGFDNPAKALLTVVKETCDNSLDACEEARILPEIHVTINEPREIFSIIDEEGHGIGELTIEGRRVALNLYGKTGSPKEVKERRNGKDYTFEIDGTRYTAKERLQDEEKTIDFYRGRKAYRIAKSPSDRFKIIIEDNGPGIVRSQIPNIFARLLYGSKFFKYSQSRGQQGIGVSSAVLYAQLTTGKPTIITSRTGKDKPVHVFHLRIDTTKNMPVILKEEQRKAGFRDHGTRIEMEVEGKYMKRYHSVTEYLKQTAAVNPYAKLIFNGPDGSRTVYERTVNELPRPAKDIKPHPHGVEVGLFERMARLTKTRNLKGFLVHDFSRVGPGTAVKIIKQAGLSPSMSPKALKHEQIDKLWRAIHATDLMKPPLDCLSPIGADKLEEGLKKEFRPEFVTAVTRPPSVYRGMPFQIEVAIAYGGEIKKDGYVKLMRFANRVPLLYQASSCAITKSAKKVEWKHYGLDRQGPNPVGPAVIAVHMASVWIPFTSESKEAIDPYPEIVKEIRLALQEAGRRLKRFVAGRKRAHEAERRASLFEKYIPEIAIALSDLTGEKKERIIKDFEKLTRKGVKNEEEGKGQDN